MNDDPLHDGPMNDGPMNDDAMQGSPIRAAGPQAFFATRVRMS